jgi:hypothetical protein
LDNRTLILITVRIIFSGYLFQEVDVKY